jgi:hypothetical protein
MTLFVPTNKNVVQQFVVKCNTGARKMFNINPLNAELNPICHLLVLLGAHHILHVSRIRVKFTGTAFINITDIV